MLSWDKVVDNHNKKLILGTVQFGIDYGVNNKLGKPSQDIVNKILENSKEIGITTLDTADLYGDSADRIGTYFSRYGHNFDVISKFCLNDARSLEDYVKDSLARLGVSSLSGYLFHRFDDFLKFDRFKELSQLKEKGFVRKLGVSVYSNEQLKMGIDNPYIDLIQLPFNFFDSSKDKLFLMEEAKKLNKEIHVRSVFLQGLFFMSPSGLEGNLKNISSSLKELQNIQKQSGIEMKDLCLSYAESFSCIDKVVVGVDSPEQVLENFTHPRQKLDESLINEIKNIRIEDSSLLNPSLWKKI